MRLIDADALYELINGGYDLNFDEVPETKRELLRMIDDQETIDTVPENYGMWYDPAASNCYRCSVCEEYTTMETVKLLYHYCPNCGAKMYGGLEYV